MFHVTAYPASLTAADVPDDVFSVQAEQLAGQLRQERSAFRERLDELRLEADADVAAAHMEAATTAAEAVRAQVGGAPGRGRPLLRIKQARAIAMPFCLLPSIHPSSCTLPAPLIIHCMS